MALPFITIIHIIAVVFSIIELSLTAYIVSIYSVSDWGPSPYQDDVSHWDRSPDRDDSDHWPHWRGQDNVGYYGGYLHGRVTFMLFNSVWSLFVLAYVGLTPKYYPRLFHKLASLALVAITMIFWFAGSIALAAIVGRPWNYRANRFSGSLEAAIAFGFFLWALFTLLTVLETVDVMRSRGRHYHGARAEVGA